MSDFRHEKLTLHPLHQLATAQTLKERAVLERDDAFIEKIRLKGVCLLSDPEDAVEWTKSLCRLVQSLDPGRPVTVGLHPGNEKDGHEVPESFTPPFRY